ncbi:MAG: cytochrome c3 family protein [Acidobacteria bacterium]|nr:cytochrome c3 family protein [Acidobacteriota bacterium]
MFALLTLAAASAFLGPRLAESSAAAPEPQRRRAATQRRAPARPRVDYTKFTHSTPAHRKDSCDSCHKSPSDNWARVRARDAAFPDITDYPEHESCLGCHRQQFFNGARPPICTVCHTAVSPRAGERHPFANPADVFARSARAKTRPGEFALIFPHDVHQDVMARAPSDAGDERGAPRFVRAAFAQDAPKKAKPNSCSICHQTYRRPGAAAPTPAPADAAAGAGASGATPALPDGLLKTTPTGHDSCFNCHWQDGGEKPFSNDCAGCHKPLPKGSVPAPAAGRDADAQLAARAGFADPFIIRKLLRRETVTFAHDEENHRDIDCASCHTRIPAISTLDDSTLKVSILSCGGSGCHINARPKKILNDEVDKKLADAAFRCAKCHVNLGDEKPPRSHLDAVGK